MSTEFRDPKDALLHWLDTADLDDLMAKVISIDVNHITCRAADSEALMEVLALILPLINIARLAQSLNKPNE